MSDDALMIVEEKKRLRSLMKAKRRALTIGWTDAMQDALVLTAMQLVKELEPASVAGYVAMHGELEMDAVFEALQDKNIPICLPVIDDAGAPLSFREWKLGDPLIVGRHNTKEPERRGRVRRPTLLFVPLLGYDRHGTRLGYGGGYYDRTIAALRDKGEVHAYGVAMRGQRYEERLPNEETDAQLDGVITEVGLERFRVHGA